MRATFQRIGARRRAAAGMLVDNSARICTPICKFSSDSFCAKMPRRHAYQMQDNTDGHVLDSGVSWRDTWIPVAMARPPQSPMRPHPLNRPRNQHSGRPSAQKHARFRYAPHSCRPHPLKMPVRKQHVISGNATRTGQACAWETALTGDWQRQCSA